MKPIGKTKYGPRILPPVTKPGTITLAQAKAAVRRVLQARPH
jgi:hypothetical protein